MSDDDGQIKRGRFITFEGGEGAGKSTQIGLLAARLRVHGVDLIETREPGGPVRDLLVKGDCDWTPMAEALLHFAARADHLKKTILPALASGQGVLCDRFADSTMAYQGYAQGLGPDIVERMYELVVGDLKPDLTLVMDLPVSVGLERAERRDIDENRYERMGTEFHETLRKAFLDIARDQPDRCALIDASGAVETIHENIWQLVRDRLDIS
jgi:dTMP kinase